jgi:hypothetical protein
LAGTRSCLSTEIVPLVHASRVLLGVTVRSKKVSQRREEKYKEKLEKLMESEINDIAQN